MKVFLSWSGDESKAIAKALYEWLPLVMQSLNPFYSPEIEKGSKSIEEINEFLEQAQFGLICLTRDNLQSRWIHYEVGALAKMRESRIWTLLHNVPYTDVLAPLAQFQHTMTTLEEMTRMLTSMNSHIEQPLDVKILNSSIERWWPDLEAELKRISTKQKDIPVPKISTQSRDDQDLLREVLETVRAIRGEIKPKVSERLKDLPSLAKFASERQRSRTLEVADTERLSDPKGG